MNLEMDGLPSVLPDDVGSDRPGLDVRRHVAPGWPPTRRAALDCAPDQLWQPHGLAHPAPLNRHADS